MNKEIVKQKEALVEEIYNEIKDAAASIVVEYRGLSVAQLSDLRKQLKKEEATITVLKNTLISRAANKAGYADLDKELEGPNALVVAKNDPCAAAKVLRKFARRNDALVVKGGIVEGKVGDAKSVDTIATLPNKEGLISMFLGCLQASVRNFACAIKAVADSKAE